MINKLLKFLILIILLINSKITFSQIPVISTPQPATFQNYSNFGNTQTTNPNYNQTIINDRTQLNNQMIMQEVQYYEQLRLQQQQIIEDAINQNNLPSIDYQLPNTINSPDGLLNVIISVNNNSDKARESIRLFQLASEKRTMARATQRNQERLKNLYNLPETIIKRIKAVISFR